MSEAVAVTTEEPWVPTNTFGSRLILLRHHLHLTQIEAAAQCGLDDGSWSNWERGSSPRKLVEVVSTIADTFGVDRNWLMWGDPRSRCLTVTAGRGQGELLTSDGVPWNHRGDLVLTS